ncbi:MAG: OmpA family protein [Candidatus Desulfofervidaceae bacterium]|nr:OmpA family protein [Candidatus Desulfofervidaceae bacterium]
MARKKQIEEEKKVNTFIVSYSSLVTILLAFFICMTTMATIIEEKVMRGFLSIRTSFGVAGGQVSPVEGTFGPLEEIVLEGVDHQAVILLEQFIKRHFLNGEVRLGMTKRGLVLALNADLVFSPGSARLSPRIYPVLDRAAMLIASCKNQVVIEGHTDAVPIKSSRFPSNWELSIARAVSVLRYFVDEKGLAKKRFVAVGYGSTRPLFPNDTPAHRAKNRRVWIVLKGTPRPVKRTAAKEVSIRGFVFKIREFLR